uniref:ABM domain-containing protein n=1 Tax=Proboscia inermis TaxID=420281 RepID=A0A7S0GEU8_9STRA|mmetsp:Transcript_28507/g.28851  ORF Transcript_28507/g.28851 Transcript_28507/m.28851 type:complete len:175 (+) Transcript_28507:60-584(+)
MIRFLPLCLLLVSPATAFGFVVSTMQQPRSSHSTFSSSSTSSALSMALVEDGCVTLVPKFKIKEGMMDEYMANLPKFLELVKANEQDTCLHYGFVGPTDDNLVICREGYKNAEGLLFHLQNVDEPLQEALRYADIVSIDVQGPSSELEKLKEPLAAFSPTYYELQPGSMRSETL